MEWMQINSKCIYRVLDNLSLQWMGILMWRHAVTTTLVGPDLGSQMKSWVTTGHQKSLCPLVEAHGMAPTSSSIMCKVIDNLHMLWIGIWMHHHAICTTLIGPDLGTCLFKNSSGKCFLNLTSFFLNIFLPYGHVKFASKVASYIKYWTVKKGEVFVQTWLVSASFLVTW